MNQFVYEHQRDEALLTGETEGSGDRNLQDSAAHYKANVDDTVTSQEPVNLEDQVGRPRATAVILTALDVEYEAVRSHLDSLQPVRLAGGARYEVGWFAGTHLNWEVAVAEIGEGNVGAAIGTVKAIEHFNPDLVLFVGVAGGLKEGMRHGEVVVASKVYGYHGGKAGSEFYSRPLAFPIAYSLEQAVREARRGGWFGGDASDSLSEQPLVQLKPIAAGEVVVASTDSDVYRHIKQHFNDAVAVDMESAGMYEAALRYEGLPALAIRGISDLLDDKSPEADADLQPRASKHAAAFAFALLGVIHPGELRARPATQASSSTPATEVGELLAQVPPLVATELERARDDAPEVTDRLLTRLAHDAASPADLVVDLLSERPYWLTSCSSPRVWAAVGEFAAAHGVQVSAMEAFVRAGELGGSEGARWMARAALAAAGNDQPDKALELLQLAQRLAGGPHTFIEVIEAAIAADAGGEPTAVVDAAQRHVGDDMIVEMMEGLALSRMGRREEALAVLEMAFENHPANAAAAVQIARLLLARFSTDESVNPIADLERAREVALQARDFRRGWRGDSAEATVLAAQAAYFARDLQGVIRISLPPPEGEANETEAASDELRTQAAYAILDTGDAQRGLELAERISDPLERDLVQAACFKKMPGSKDLAKEAYRRALAAARGSQKRIRAYFGLAELAEWPLPDLEDVAEQDREVYDLIVAKSELVRGNIDEAIRRYRTWTRRGSSMALDELVTAYIQNNRVDEAVIALHEGAVQHNNLELRYRAAHELDLAGRPEEAEAEARHAMDVVPAGSSTHRELRKLRIELAAKLDDWPGVEEQARAALQEGIELPGVRWALVFSLYNQGQPELALREMVRQPRLEARDEQEGFAAVQLYRLGPKSPEAVRFVLDLSDRFAASERVSAAALTGAYEISANLELSPSLLGRLRTLDNNFFERFPESKMLSRIEADDTETSTKKLVDHLEKTLAPGASQYDEMVQGVSAGRLPYGFLSAFAGRAYAEALIKKAAGFLPVVSADESVLAIEREAAEKALDGAVMAEASTLHVLGLVGMDPNELLANFSRVLIPRVVLEDAVAARESLAQRSSVMMGWDAKSNQPMLTEFSEEQVEAWVAAANALVERLRACEVFSPRESNLGGQEIPERARPWAGPVQAAKEEGLPLFSDDSVLRLMARSEDVPAFGTLSLLHALVGREQIGEDALREAVMALRRNLVADLPFDAEQILMLAAEDGWRAGPGTFSLTRPALWQDHQRALSLYQDCIEGVLRHDETSLPVWCSAATVGFARGWPAALGVRRAGQILAYTVHMGSILSDSWRADLFAASLETSRRSASTLGLGDTLPSAVEALKEMMEATLGISGAASAFAQLADGLDIADRTTALHVFLRPPSS